MAYLIDTNVISEIQKGTRANKSLALNNVPDSFPVIDGLLAATAIEHDLIFVTRNIKDVKRSDVQLLNPFL